MQKRNIILVSCVLLVGVLSIFILRQRHGGSVALQPQPAKYFSILDGLPVSSAYEATPQVLGVMIDNHPDARPQYGLLGASVVYEAPVEGGITRYFAIFDASREVEKVGPVRSARTYFIDWMREYGAAPYVHSGGSPEALSILANDDDVWDANEFSRGQYFWRGKESAAPHNLFTSSSLWNGLIDHYGQYFLPRLWNGWQFDTSSSITALPMSTSTVTIAFAPGYQVEWRYNTTLGRYLRYINGKQHFDPSGKPIVADNVVVQLVKMKTVDEVGRKEIQTVGEGNGQAFFKGRVIQMNWSKPSPLERTRFFSIVPTDKGIVEVPLTPGVTWVEVVPGEVNVDY